MGPLKAVRLINLCLHLSLEHGLVILPGPPRHDRGLERFVLHRLPVKSGEPRLPIGHQHEEEGAPRQ